MGGRKAKHLPFHNLVLIVIYVEMYKGKSLNSHSSVKPKSFAGAITKLEHRCGPCLVA